MLWLGDFRIHDGSSTVRQCSCRKMFGTRSLAVFFFLLPVPFEGWTAKAVAVSTSGGSTSGAVVAAYAVGAFAARNSQFCAQRNRANSREIWLCRESAHAISGCCK